MLAAATLVAAAAAVAAAVGLDEVSVRAVDVGMVVTWSTIGLLGALLSRRRPGHRIGMLLGGGGLR